MSRRFPHLSLIFAAIRASISLAFLLSMGMQPVLAEPARVQERIVTPIAPETITLPNDRSAPLVLAGDSGVYLLPNAQWEMMTVDQSGWTAHQNSLAVDSSGRIHIAYFDSANQDLSLHSRVSLN